MAKINTTNYQPVTTWNGTQDLFIVEQPDGTKVATPEQVKQYVEAGDFEATGEIIDGHGNILAKKADVTTVTIPRFTPSEAGWRRICKVKPVDMHTVEGMIYVGGFWSNGLPPSASVAVNIMYNYASLTLLSSVKGDDIRITAMRLVRVSGAEYWLDVYLPAYSQITGSFTLKFIGDIVVSDIQDPISITTDSTTASAEISLNQKVSGIVLTNNDIQMGRGVFPSANAGLQTVIVTFPKRFNGVPAVMVSWDDTSALQSYFKFPLSIIDITEATFTVRAERLNANSNWYFRYIALNII